MVLDRMGRCIPGTGERRLETCEQPGEAERRERAIMSPKTVLLTDAIGGDTTHIKTVLEEAGARLTVATQETWKASLPAADALLVNLARVDGDAIRRAGRCRVIARLGVGVDSVDVRAATAQGIWVTNVPHYCTEEVADHTLALILSLQRRLRLAQDDLRAGSWNQIAYRGIRRVSSTTLGVVGLGQLGRAVAQRALSLGYRVIGHDPDPSTPKVAGLERVNLDELLNRVDIVTLHVPLLPATRNLLDAERLARMKPGSFLVNTSRGGLVDEVALLCALNNGHLAGAALDAFEQEPLPATSPLHGVPTLVLTPHIAFLSEESLVSLQVQAASEVVRVLGDQKPLHPVNSI
jgi:D-3-phosphoglycerate dehydrogenase